MHQLISLRVQVFTNGFYGNLAGKMGRCVWVVGFCLHFHQPERASSECSIASMTLGMWRYINHIILRPVLSPPNFITSTRAKLCWWDGSGHVFHPLREESFQPFLSSGSNPHPLAFLDVIASLLLCLMFALDARCCLLRCFRMSGRISG